MSTQMDPKFADGVVDGVKALRSEVERLERILMRIEMVINPKTSPTGDTEMIVKKFVTEARAEIAELRGRVNVGDLFS